MAGLGFGQLFGAPAHDGAEVFLLERTADTEAVEGHGAQILACLAAQVLVLGALNHAEQCLVGLAHALCGQALVLSDAAQRPQAGAFKRLLLVAAGVVQGGQLVEGKHDVGTDLVLHLHGHLGGEAVNRAVNMRLEVHAVVVNVSEAFLALRHVVVAEGAAVGALSVRDGAHVDDLLEAGAQAHDLEATGVSEGGAVPVHEGTQAACSVQDFGAGLQVQVVSVGEQSLSAELLHGFGQDRLDGCLGAHGGEGGGLNLSVRGGDDTGASAELSAVGFYTFSAG